MPYKDKEKQKEAQLKYYRNHKEDYRKRRNIARRENIKKYNEYKSHLKCELCEESCAFCLDFHHRNPKTKLFGITEGVRKLRKRWDVVLEEVQKCVVLCRNCHAKLHAGVIKI